MQQPSVIKEWCLHGEEALMDSWDMEVFLMKTMWDR